MKNCIYEPVFGLFLLFNFQIDSALTFSSRLFDIFCYFRVRYICPLKKLLIIFNTKNETKDLLINANCNGIIVCVFCL